MSNINRKNWSPNVFSLRSSSLSFVQRTLTEMAEIALSGEKGVGTGAQLAPK